jgi:hypothetical protein
MFPTVMAFYLGVSAACTWVFRVAAFSLGNSGSFPVALKHRSKPTGWVRAQETDV